jgi:hypothetical protein
MKYESKTENDMNDSIEKIVTESEKKNLNDITTKWTRNCPKCNKEISYKNKYKCKYAERDKVLCNSCCQIGIFTGRKLSQHQIELLKQRTGKNNPMFGKSHSIENKIKWSLIHKKKFVKSHTEETKQKLREYRANWIINNKGGSQYNPNACTYFDLLNVQNNWKLQHALNGGEIMCTGYFLDAYDKERNIVVEYDEPKHYDVYGNLKQKDVLRQQRIITHLGCKFFRYNEKTKELYEIKQS